MKPIIASLIILFIWVGCSSPEDITSNNNNNTSNTGNNNNNNNNDDTNTQTNNWTIPVEEVFDGGPGKDGIPAIEQPKFMAGNSGQAATFMDDEDLVVGIKLGDVIKAYPHKILDWHEIVNDEVNKQKISINYCPLTGTAFAWRGVFDNFDTTFGVSGLLYNSNLILYDRQTDSYWSQIKLEAVHGKSVGKKPALFELYETTWGAWKAMFPNTLLLSNQQQVVRDYQTYPYGPYKEEHDFLLFPVNPLNTELPAKERVFALLNDNKAQVYRFNKFGNGATFKHDDKLVIGNQELITAFELPTDMQQLAFTFNWNPQSQTVFLDNEGNKWSLDGVAVEGPRKGQKLAQAVSVMSYWFAIAPFYEPSFVK